MHCPSAPDCFLNIVNCTAFNIHCVPPYHMYSNSPLAGLYLCYSTLRVRLHHIPAGDQAPLLQNLTSLGTSSGGDSLVKTVDRSYIVEFSAANQISGREFLHKHDVQSPGYCACPLSSCSSLAKEVPATIRPRIPDSGLST